MTGTQRKQYEMLQRVREFGNTYREVLSSSAVATQLVAEVNTAIDELATTDMQKLSASSSARAGGKAKARRALVELLQKGSQLARVLRAEGRQMPPCELPASKSDQALLTAGRQLALNAAAFATEFGGHGMGSAYVTAVTAGFEAASNEQGGARADHIAARARIQRVLTAAQRQVRRLELIVNTLLATDEEAQAVWKQARRIQGVRGPRGSGEAEASPPPAAAGPPQEQAA